MRCAPVVPALVSLMAAFRDFFTAPQAFLQTDLDATPAEILGWFVQRWSTETTF
jgi:hypothetical protein